MNIPELKQQILSLAKLQARELPADAEHVFNECKVLRSAACCPYGKYTVAGGVGKITIGIGVPWLPANANAIHQFHYHVIAVQ